MTTFSQQEKERLRKQRERQRDYRAQLKLQRRPGRDDAARLALIFTIMRLEKNGTENQMHQFMDSIVKLLVAQGFDKKASDDVMEDLVEKYTKGSWDFRRKPHLRRPHPDEGDSG